MGIEVGLLGPVEARVDGSIVDLRGPRQRRLLALLALQPGVLVNVERIVDAVWSGGDLPVDPRETLRTYVSRLRSALGDKAVVVGRDGGYLLAVDPTSVDLHRFEALRAEGTLDSLTGALALWRGPALSGFEHEEWARPDAVRVEELGAATRDAQAGLLLEAGRVEDAIAALQRAAAQAPLRERTHELLMSALHRAGRQAEALRAFQRYRHRLATDLGLDPSAALRALEARIARDDPSWPPAVPAAATDGNGTPRLRGYELRDRIGDGAFAVVYRGVQPSVGREVAVKQIRAELANTAEFIRRFEAEAHLVARLEHPHVVPLYDYWREPDSAYLVMRWLRGGSLGGAVEAAGPWPLDRVLSMATQVGAALACAHRAGVVHRDVKPANILLDEEGNAYLGDFGIAQETAGRIVPTDSLSVGSPAYASPEQLRREAVGPPADIHGLGIVLYEALTGSLPFPDAADAAALVRHQLEDPLPSICARRPDLPPALDAVLARATAKAPADRFQTVEAFLDELLAVPHPAGVHLPAVRRQGAATLVEGPGADNPYKGLRAFDEADAADFYGRERLVRSLLDRLTGSTPVHRLVALVGPSGSGKSSVVRAGLLRALRSGRIPGSEKWFVTTMVPGTHPFDELESALLRLSAHPHPGLGAQLSVDNRGVLAACKRVLADDSAEMVLVIDQFEELFTLVPSERDRLRFLDALAVAVTATGSPVRVVLTLRADFYDRPLRYASFAPLLSLATVPVTPLAPDELEMAITAPAQRAGVEFEPGLVAEIMADLASQPGALPLLQYALTELYDRRVGAVLTVERYRAMGGLAGALAARADHLFVGATPPAQLALRRLMTRLVTFGEGSEDTRRRVRRSELVEDDATADVIDAYGSARLLSFDRDPVTREPTVEVAHEALIRRWPRLRDWLDDDRAGLRVHRHLTTAAAAWQAAGRDVGELYRGGRLHAAEDWAVHHTADLNRVEGDFLAAGVAARVAEEAAERERLAWQVRQNRRLRRLLSTVAVVAVLAAVAGALAYQQGRRADQAAAVATRAASDAETRRLVSEAAQLASTNRRVALLLAAEAYRRDPGVESLGAVQRVLVGSDELLGYLGGGTRYEAVTWIDEHRVAAARADIIDVFGDDGTRQGSIPVRSARVLAVSADGRWLAAGTDAAAVLVDLRAPTSPPRLFATGALVQALAFSADGSRLAVGDRDGRLVVLRVDDGSVALTVDAHPERTFSDLALPGAVGEIAAHVPASAVRGVAAVAFDPSGGVVATAGWGYVRLWDAASSERRTQIELTRTLGAGRVAATARSVSFAGDGRLHVADRFGVSSIDTTGTSEPQRREFPGSDSALIANNVDSPVVVAGGVVLESSGPGRLQVIELDGSQGSREVETQFGQITGAARSAKGDRAAVSGDDGLAIVALDGSRIIARAVGVAAPGELTISDDGRRVFRATLTPSDGELWTIDDDAVHTLSPRDLGVDFILSTSRSDVALTFTRPDDLAVIDADSGDRLLQVEWNDPGGSPWSGLSPDGQILALAQWAGPLELRSLADGRLLHRFEDTALVPRGMSFRTLSFHPEGRRLAAAASNGAAIVWELDTDTITVLSRGGGDVVQVAFSHDGRLLATVRDDGAIVLRDAATLQPTGVPFVGDTAGSLVNFGPWFSADDRFLVTTGDGKARLWDTASGRQIGGAFPADPRWNSSASPNGRWLVSNLDGHILRWDLDVGRWPELVCRAAGRNLTAEEWRQFGPADTPARPTCPQYP